MTLGQKLVHIQRWLPSCETVAQFSTVSEFANRTYFASKLNERDSLARDLWYEILNKSFSKRTDLLKNNEPLR